jgi:hypothetical protein
VTPEPHKRPRAIEVVDALPRDPVGKVLKQLANGASVPYQARRYIEYFKVAGIVSDKSAVHVKDAKAVRHVVEGSVEADGEQCGLLLRRLLLFSAVSVMVMLIILKIARRPE